MSKKDWDEVNNSLSQEVLDRGLLEDLLEELDCDGVRAYRGGLSYRAACPVHLGDDPENLEVRADGDVLPIRWACYSQQCHKDWKPSLLGLVRGVLSAPLNKKVHPAVAASFLRKFLGGTPTAGPRRVPSRPKVQPKLLSVNREQVRERLVIPSPYFLTRGFSPAVLDRLDVGHSPRLGKSVVPLHADDGRTCVGYMARTEMPACETCHKCHRPGGPCRYGQPKWKTMDGFPKGSHLYNYHAALRSGSRVVILVEGPGDVWRVEEAGYSAVAMLGTDLSAQQLRKLRDLGKWVFIALDNDKAGRRALARVCDCLRGTKLFPSPLFVPPAFKDPGDVPIDRMVSWLSGKIPNP